MTKLRLLPRLWEEFFGEPWPARQALRVSAVWSQPAKAGETGAHWAPAVEILESPECIVLILEIPGVRREDISVEVEEDLLRVAGEKPLPAQEAGQTYLRMECPYGPFERSFALGTRVDPQSVNASYRDGVLRLRIEKVQRLPSRVKVNVE